MIYILGVRNNAPCKYLSIKVIVLTHLLTSLPDPSAAIIKEIYNLFFKFIWNNRRDKIRRDTIMRDYEDGGHEMINVTKYLNIYLENIIYETPTSKQ
jgi:hypothetical protein